MHAYLVTFPQANSSTDQHFNPTVGTVKVPDSHSKWAENTDQDAMHAVDSQVCLLVWSKAVVHFPLQVDGQVRNAQDGTGQVQQAVGETGTFL